MGRKDDDARNWTSGDAANQEAELAGISNPASATRIEKHRTFEKNKGRAEELLSLAAKACRNAGKGDLAEMKKVPGGYAVIITSPGKKK